MTTFQGIIYASAFSHFPRKVLLTLLVWARNRKMMRRKPVLGAKPGTRRKIK